MYFAVDVIRWLVYIGDSMLDSMNKYIDRLTHIGSVDVTNIFFPEERAWKQPPKSNL